MNYFRPDPGWEPTIDEALLEAQMRLEAANTPSDLPTGTLELAALFSTASVRVGLFCGVDGGDDPAQIAVATAQALAALGQRCILIDVGQRPAALLGGAAAAGLGDLLSGRISFGDAIRKDMDANLHYLPMGAMDADAPLQRLTLVIGALAHTYDKVLLVSDRLSDWPHAHVRPHLAAIVCKAQTGDDRRRAAYAEAVGRGAYNALIVRRSPDHRQRSDTAPAPAALAAETPQGAAGGSEAA